MAATPAGMSRAELEAVVAPFGQSRTLPVAAYTSPETLAWETENLFEKTWVCVGRLDDLLQPGQIRAVEVAGESVLLCRDQDGVMGSPGRFASWQILGDIEKGRVPGPQPA
jgi:Rieske 2Fe-2S family protein